MPKNQIEAMTILEQCGVDDIESMHVWQIRFESEKVAHKFVDLIYERQSSIYSVNSLVPSIPELDGSVYVDVVTDQSTVQIEIKDSDKAFKLFSGIKHQINQLVREDQRILKDLLEKDGRSDLY